MKELQRLLLEDQEEGIDELEVLEHVVEDVQSLHSRCPSAFIADGVEEAILVPNGDNLFQHASQQQSTAYTEGDVMNDKGSFEWLGWNLVLSHQALASKYDDEIGNDDGQCDEAIRQGRTTGLP